MLKPLVIKNLIFSGIFLCVLLILVFLEFTFDFALLPASVFWIVVLTIHFSVFLFLCRSMFSADGRRYLRIPLVIAVGSANTFVFGFLALVVLVNFHLFLGGKL